MDAWKNVGDEVTGLSSIKEKIKKKMWREANGMGVSQI